MSAATRTALAFTAVTTVGGLLPADMLLRVAEARNLPGTRPADYGLPASVPVRDEAERAWEYLKPLWRDLRTALPSDPVTGAPAADPTGRAGTDWLAQLFRKLDFGALTEVGTAGVPADSDPEKRFPVSHRHGPALVHLIPWNQELDKRPAAGQVPAQSMLQDCLNRTEAHLWAVLTNGRRLRLLRDSSSFATAAYVDFDLEAIFDGELFSEFVLLYCVLHASRFEVAQGAAPSGCWLEKWRAEAVTSGARALDQLRLGVQNALTVLGTGFLRHPENVRLREDVDPKALRDALLRLVYRLLFVFVAEDRDALLDPAAGERERGAYERYFSSARLRERARRRQGTAHGDQYEALRIVLDALGTEGGRPELGLPGLGGLFSPKEADAPLDGLKLSNESLLAAVRHLAQVRDPGARRWRSVDYRHLDAEELGSVYESLLELEPKHSVTDRSFELIEVAGNSRKTTGSYYTPSSLIECLLDTTLDPVIDDAVKRGEQRATAAGRPDPADDIVAELLSLTVCDPACGSGHFLVASARRIAKRVASVRERNPEPTVDAVRHALHEVVARCIYGVDLNPMAVELAKVSLWLEALEPGKPLGFLDAHVKHGNGLIGATPKLLADGVPDDAFKPIEGDDKKYAAGLVKRNKIQRGGQDELSFDTDTLPGNDRYAAELARITAAPADSLEQVRAQESAYRAYVEATAYVQDLHAADAWCAAFVWPKQKGAPEAPTDQVFRALRKREQSAVPDATRAEIMSLRDQYRFFHWHLEFPEVFAVPESGARVQPGTGWAGGFDAVVGNPPWEHLELKEQEFFSSSAPEIANAPGSRRKNLIEHLQDANPHLHEAYQVAKRVIDGTRHFASVSGLYPLCGRGRIKTDSIFAEQDRRLGSPRGRIGIIVPTGIATDATTQFFFQDLIAHKSLASLLDFENSSPLFPSVHRSFKFCVLALTGSESPAPVAHFAFSLQTPAELGEPDKTFPLTLDEITLLNPNTKTCPVFRSRRDARIALHASRKFPPLRSGTSQGPYQLTIRRIFNMGLREVDAICPREITPQPGHTIMLESKLTHAYNHRFATYSNAEEEVRRYSKIHELDNPGWRIQGRRSIAGTEVSKKLDTLWQADWIFAWSDVARNNDARTLIALVAPRTASDFTLRLGFPAQPLHAPLLLAAFNSFCVDYLLRLRLGGLHVSDYLLEQLPIPSPDVLSPHEQFIFTRVLELTYTAYDVSPFAHDLGDTNAPFRWDEDRRAVIRAELDALFFHLYGIDRDDTAYILNTFNVTRDNDMKAHGEYRTKRLILAEYDRMAAAGLTLENPLTEGESGTYRSTLTPPPGQGPRHD
ncbi:Eco57I restriction-modification methylase domain-containing protein [Streptomyces sp. NPDC101213]|uniref:Eco57I restriction-modification methylase domain-containing protein n=1 Tax=Streptomyces sp. NPDC101213 TaxID=3366130 RepID=UPI0037FC0BFA